MTSGTGAATVVLVYHAMSIGVLASSMTGPAQSRRRGLSTWRELCQL